MMKRLYIKIVWLYIGMTVSILPVACTDEQEKQEQGDTLELLTYAKIIQDAGTTRAASIPSGYENFAAQHPEIATENTSIGLFLAGSTVSALRRIVYETDHWQSYAKVMANEDYYIYGFVPVEASGGSSITPREDYSRGANLNIENLKVLSDKDICVVVGVQGAESASGNVNVTLGHFAYTGKEKGKNHVYLLFDHLYSAVQFSIRIDEEYAKLRTVRLKSVVLKTNEKAMANVQVEILAREQGTVSSVNFTPRGTDAGEFVLLDAERNLTTSYTTLGNTCYFSASARSSLKLVSTYDVYDRYGNIVRENCTSENNLDILSAVSRGQKRNVKLTVNPTYLYQLSDDDLDSPVVEVN